MSSLSSSPPQNDSSKSQTEIDKKWMDLACALALKSYSEGGCPIGACLVRDSDQTLLGKGHNQLVQSGAVTMHGEMSALTDAGRMQSRRGCTMYTSLSPCFMCSGTIIQFKIGRVVIGDASNTTMEESKKRLFAENGVEIVVMENDENVKLVKKFIAEKPELWLEDWGGK